MLKVAFIIYCVLLVAFVGCTFYVRSYHDDKPLILRKECKKCDGIKCQDIALSQENDEKRTKENDDDVKSE